MLLIRGADHERYVSLLVDWRKSNANKQRDLYPDNLYIMLDIMRFIPAQKKKKPGSGNNKSGNKEISKKEETADESSFATKGLEEKQEIPAHIKCHCCGDNHYVGDCRN